MTSGDSIYEELSNRTVSSEKFNQPYKKLLQMQNLGTVSQTDLSLDEIRLLINCASVFSFSSEKFKQIAYKIAVILSEKYCKDKYPDLTGPIQYIMICAGQMPVINKIVGDGNIDYFSLFSESGVPFNPMFFKEVLYKQAGNLIEFDKKPENPIYFTDFQRKIYNGLSAGKSISISAPTSSGKSFLLIAYLAKRLRENDHINIVYIVPTRALINQVIMDIRSDLRKFNIDDLWLSSTSKTPEGSHSPSKQIFVLTQERYHGLLFDSEFYEDIDVLIIDEAQKVSDQNRGILLEEVIEESLRRYQSLQTIFITPFSKNPEKFSKMFHIPECEIEKTSLSPVSQNILKLNISNKNYLLWLSTTELESRDDIEIDSGKISKLEESEFLSKDWELLWAAKKFGGDSNIVYCNSPSKCVNYAMSFICSQSPLESNKHIEDACKFLQENIHEDYFLIECIKMGIGYHHGKMPIPVRNLVEELFKNKHLKYLFCTSTLLEGVNLPAQNIFLTTPRRGVSNPLDRLNFWNLAGRAGRLLKDYYGNIYCINIQKWKGYIPDPDDVEDEIESVLESAVIEKDEEWMQNLKNYYKNSKLTDSPIEQAITKFLILSMKNGESDYISDLKTRNPNFNENSLEIMKDEINKIAESIEIPSTIIQKNSTINPFKLQMLLEYFRGYPQFAIPLYPTDKNFYLSLQDIIRVIDSLLLNKKNGSYKYFTNLISRWINEDSMSELIKNKLYRSKCNNITQNVVNQEIENLFSDLNDTIRFSYQKYLKCYIDVLLYHYSVQHLDPHKVNKNLPLFIELGTFKPNTIILQSIGLSRPAAIAINHLVKSSFVDEAACVQWIHMNRDLIKSQISPILFREIEKII